MNVVDLGIDVSSARFVEAVAEHKPQALALSALLTTTMNNMASTVKEIKAELPNQVVLVGGAPLNQAFADDVGADAYCRDAAQAADIGMRLVGERREATGG